MGSARERDDEQRWVLISLIPNLELPPHDGIDFDRDSPDLNESGMTLGSTALAIVPGDDPRVRALAERTPAVAHLLGSVRDAYGEPATAAVLIAREGASVRETRKSVVGFRNAIALSVVLHARAGFIANEGRQGPNWTDTFELHPTEVDRHGRIVTHSPSVMRLHEGHVLVARAPHVNEDAKRLFADTYLIRTLGAEWRRRYHRHGRRDRFGSVLFRSLDFAFHAGAVPHRTGGSLQDFGIHASLWVAAIEALAWPASERASEAEVQKLLRRYPWRPRFDVRRDRERASAFAARRYSYRVKQSPTKGGMPRPDKLVRVGPLERAYHALNAARNAFLHGNPVTPRTLLPWGHGRGMDLVAVGALLYRMALRAYLSERYPVADTMSAGSWFEASDELHYEHAVRAIFPGIRDE